jgi:DNA-binding FadR family transcriptional regulator
MSVDGHSGSHQGRSRVRFQRLAEQVADDLRRRILLGDLGVGETLPIEEVLRGEYPVSKPTLREAMRVLESEGLITVRRGSIGGAVVHRPTASNVAYTLGLVLVSRGINIGDVAGALREVEPACAAACAQRSDRAETVVPRLRALHEKSVEVVDDLVEVTTMSRRFHESMVELCGNQSLSILAGALAVLWTSHESGWAHRVGDLVDIPREERLAALDAHRELIEAIQDGDSAAARQLSASHLDTSQNYPGRGEEAGPVDPETVREVFIGRLTETEQGEG